ncbi:MAG: hypothetical protein Q8R67_16515 [Rhodoferax sp.]|nr:hypothetical protein [Rhodoferax sp.]MDP3653279.1 hypothetical protein [Rhodoferax sp.]
MKAQKLLAVGTAISILAATVPWVVTFGGQALSLDPSDWGVFGDYFGGILSGPLALAGFVALLITIQQQRAFAQAEQDKANDLKYFESAQCCLQRAYAAIRPVEADKPPKERLAWLTTARWLLAADALANKISAVSPALRDAYELEAEHYRMLFSDFLRPNRMDSVFFQWEFFEGDRTVSGSELEERSVRIVLEFMEWPELKKDAIDKVPLYTREEVESMHVWLRGFQRYLEGKLRFQREAPSDDA